jgi:hypothetical protein
VRSSQMTMCQDCAERRPATRLDYGSGSDRPESDAGILRCVVGDFLGAQAVMFEWKVVNAAADAA